MSLTISNLIFFKTKKGTGGKLFTTYLQNTEPVEFPFSYNILIYKSPFAFNDFIYIFP